MTFDEAVQAQATEEQYKSYLDGISGRTVPLHERRALAERFVGHITFDWEIPRTPLGQYMWKWSVKAVVERCLLAAPLRDLTWSRQGKDFNLSPSLLPR
jgi:isocitrate lyase